RESARVRGRARLRQLVDTAEAAELGAGLRRGIRISRLVEEELAKIAARPELAVLGSLEGRRSFRLGQSVGVVGSGPVHIRVMDGDPVRPELVSIVVEGAPIRRQDVVIGLSLGKGDWLAGGRAQFADLQRLKPSPLGQIELVLRHETKNEAV